VEPISRDQFERVKYSDSKEVNGKSSGVVGYRSEIERRKKGETREKWNTIETICNLWYKRSALERKK